LLLCELLEVVNYFSNLPSHQSSVVRIIWTVRGTEIEPLDWLKKEKDLDQVRCDKIPHSSRFGHEPVYLKVQLVRRVQYKVY
jgi:hypothetical protein